MSYLDGFLGESDNELDIAAVVLEDDDATDDLIDEIGALERRNPRRRRAVRRLRKRTAPRRPAPTKNTTAKGEFEARFHMLPAEIKKALAAKKLQLVDYAIYGIRDVSGQNSMEMLQNADDKTNGKTNINARKLDANKYFLCTAIQLQVGTFTAVPSDATFGVPTANMLNGEFSLEVGGKIIVPSVPGSVFDTNGRSDVPKGYMKLENPKFIAPMTEIVPEIKVPANFPVNTAVKINLIGVIVEKN